MTQKKSHILTLSLLLALCFFTGVSAYGAPHHDGSLKWSFDSRGSRSSPAIGKDGTVYVGGGDYNVYALNPNGTKKWSWVPVGAPAGRIESPPAIGADGTIYVSSDWYVYALNPDDGSQIWSFATGNAVYACPAIGADGTVFVGSTDGYFYAINPDGTKKWRLATGRIDVSNPAIGKDGTIYVGGVYIFAINSSSGGLANTPWPKFHHDARNTGLSTPLKGRKALGP